MLTTWVAIAAVLGVPFAVIGLLFTARQQRMALDAAAEQAKRNRRDELAAAVQTATEPLMQEVVYWRDRSQAFEMELLRERRGNQA